MSFENSAELRLPACDDEPDHLALQGAAYLEILLGLLQRRPRHRRGALSASLDQAFDLQSRQRRACERAAHAELATDHVFRQPGARGKRLLDDRLTQGLIGGLGARGRGGHGNSCDHVCWCRGVIYAYVIYPASIRYEPNLCAMPFLWRMQCTEYSLDEEFCRLQKLFREK